jgi:undecaprenyl pyrophosphate phosphatase UppP
MLVVYPILDVKATNYNVSVGDYIQTNDFPSPSSNHIIIEKDKQIANLSGQVEALHSVETQSLTVGILGAIAGIGTIVIEGMKHRKKIRDFINDRKKQKSEMGNKKKDLQLIAYSIAIGSIITITYDALAPCFEGIFNVHTFTCNLIDSLGRTVAILIAFVVGIICLKILMGSQKTDSNSNPES